MRKQLYEWWVRVSNATGIDRRRLVRYGTRIYVRRTVCGIRLKDRPWRSRSGESQ